MGFNLFKNGDQLFDEGVDLVKRNDYQRAREKFSDTLEKEGSENKKALARLYLALIDTGSNRENIGYYKSISALLAQHNYGTFEFGLSKVPADELQVECELAVIELEATKFNGDYMEKGQKMLAAAQRYQADIGDRPLHFEEMYKGNTNATGSREALILQAMAYETMGRGAVHDDPKQGAEYMQMAYNLRRMIGDSGEDDLKAMKAYARSGKCWLCGRPISGEGIHFIAVPSPVEGAFRKADEGKMIKSCSEDSKSIYMCMPCYNAISNRADQISQKYYDQSIQQMRAMEARLEAEIQSVRSSIIMVRR